MAQRTQEQISYNMSRIRSTETGIEVALRQELRRRHLHYRKNVKALPGKPDVVFAGYRVAVFCDGEFWHGYDWKHRQADLKGNRAFWVAKIERNMARDRKVNRELRAAGWTVLRFWGRALLKDPKGAGARIERALVAALLTRWRRG